MVLSHVKSNLMIFNQKELSLLFLLLSIVCFLYETLIGEFFT
jgi:hypothetical protein